MKNLIFNLIFLSSFQLVSFSQTSIINGIVSEMDEHHDLMPIPFVNVYWSGTSHGTVTNGNGEFSIERHNNIHQLVISYVGYLNDTLVVDDNQSDVNIVLTTSQELDEVVIAKRLGGSYISKLTPLKTEVITSAGLQKLPCCDLSESFENSATVDVGYSDAVTGAKHIKMLGLAGIYSQMLYENIPYLRGLESAFGLNYVPGPWMESIQISKGTASVINGYESTTGQINIEYKKPEKSPPLFLNLFANSYGRLEGNATSAIKVNDKWSTMILAHGSTMQNKIDRNGDSFLDIPMKSQINVFNRWKYNPGEIFHMQFGLSVLDETRKGGQTSYNYNDENSNQSYYGLLINTRRYRGYGKVGILFPEEPYQSIGFITSATFYDQDAFFGLRNYEGSQLSYYANLIYQTIIKTTDHKINIGASYMFDDYYEKYDNIEIDRVESVPGVFGQYTYTNPGKFNGIIGLRTDYHSVFGLLVTPRIHFRYQLDDHTSLRSSAGRGYRSASILAENMGILATSRSLVFLEDFNIEEAWNYGFNVTRDFHLINHREINISLDIYRTDFENRIIVDMDQDVSSVYFYNLNGKSYSNSFQAEVRAEPLERFDITLAYRDNDVKATYNGDLLQAPLTSKYKGLITLSYATDFNIWTFDLTGQLNGQSRLPDTRMNPVAYQRDEYSPAFFILHAQITKRFKHFDIYAGGENLTDFRQEDPIIASDDPFGQYFDASIVWGPLLGRRFYAGIRFTLK